jgi:DNA-binding transcriptional LysR family regulator
MDLRQLQYVLAVSEELNFTRAARRCHIAQSGLSHQVAALEAELGAVLFERTSRSVQLTPAGMLFLPHARTLVAVADRASDELAALRGTVQGHLKVGAIPFGATGVDLLGLLSDFQMTHPSVDISVTDEGSLSSVNSVLSGSMDVSFVGLFAHQVPNSLIHRLLGVEPLVAVVPPTHPLRGTSFVDLPTLSQGARFLESQPDSGLRAQTDAACERARVRRQVACELRNPADLASLALRGLGVTIVPAPVAETAAAGEFESCILRLTDTQALQPVAFIHRDPAPARPAVQAFLRLIDRRWADQRQLRTTDQSTDITHSSQPF